LTFGHHDGDVGIDALLLSARNVDGRDIRVGGELRLDVILEKPFVNQLRVAFLGLFAEGPDHQVIDGHLLKPLGRGVGVKYPAARRPVRKPVEQFESNRHSSPHDAGIERTQRFAPDPRRRKLFIL
jgi:hypothetical protein